MFSRSEREYLKRGTLKTGERPGPGYEAKLKSMVRKKLYEGSEDLATFFDSPQFSEAEVLRLTNEFLRPLGVSVAITRRSRLVTAPEAPQAVEEASSVEPVEFGSDF